MMSDKPNLSKPGNTTLVTLIFILLVTSVLSMAQQTTHGFKLIEKRFVKELNADCYYYTHVKSGARLFKIAARDPNKTFGIAFKTLPESDNGAPHIMEHSVLNGSKNFPVKSPFDELSKGSLKTFINAFTSKDFTFYPVASMNEKDYFNLMHVYLDAVFNPLIYTDTRILKQEGWHYDLPAKDDPVAYKGVVYNEMKGAFSSPTRELRYQIFKNLFPDNAYCYEAGGYPSAIPTLTQEAFIKFHQKFYHPDNSYIYLYGDGDLDKELAFIDENYLSRYNKSGNKITLDDQKPFTAMKDLTFSYPVMPDSKTEGQTYLSISFVAGHNTDEALTGALDIICEVLVNQESAPVRLALQNAGIGQDVSASNSNYKQNTVTITVQNANPGDKEKFLEIVNNTFREAISKGLNKEAVRGVLNRFEFQLREGNDSQKGLSCFNQMQTGWFFADNPFQGLEYEKPLAILKKSLTSDYLEKTIQQYFINNPHSLLLTLVPKPGLDNEKNAAQEVELKNFKSNLSPEALDKLVTENQELVAFQKKENTPEALATIPVLDLKDINPAATWYGVEEQKVGGVPLLVYDAFTNDIDYVNLFFDLRSIPQEMIPYASLLSNLLELLGTEVHSYGDLDQVININTGGFYTSIRTYMENLDDNKMLPYFVVDAKAMKDKRDKLFELSAEVLLKTVFTDKERLKTVLTKHQSQLENRLKRDGYGIALSRMPSYFTNQGMFNEMTDGLDYYRFVTALTNDFDARFTEITSTLKQVTSTLFTRKNLIVSVTCSKKDLEPFTKQLTSFINTLPEGKKALNNWVFKPVKKNEGLLSSSKVQYVVQGYNFKKLGYTWDGRMRVLNQIISRDWLQNRVRVIGGAYGGSCSINPSGAVSFQSYRDPNLKETLDNYTGTVDYLNKLDIDGPTMNRYIIGTISNIDRPQTPSDQGETAINYYFSKRSREDLQKDRNAILSCKPQDIRAFSKMISDVLSQSYYCVYGNADKLKAKKDLFTELIPTEK
ncbi:MAG: insulinase family protein [Bacteroidetes bacterium]|nr:insulinase family protein [Bacteroidota bacterium]